MLGARARRAIRCEYPKCLNAAAMVEVVAAGQPYANGDTDLLPRPEPAGGTTGTIRISGFLPYASFSTPVHDYAGIAGGVLAAGDRLAETLFDWDPEWAPFYCPVCERAYCSAHWRLEPVFDEAGFDYYSGSCLYGHRHKIDH